MTNRALWHAGQDAQSTPTTARQVGRIVCRRQISYEVGDHLPLDGTVWSVLGIFEPAHPRDPWTVALVAWSDGRAVLRSPSILVAQCEVIRVYDGLDFGEV